MEDDDYRRVISALNSLPSSDLAYTGDGIMVRNPTKIKPLMFQHLAKCGIQQGDLEKKLSAIHVTGTKGKGSTCAYCESILRQYGYRTGFLSSPHLCSVRERIRINSEPLSKEKFTEHFWNVYKKLEQGEGSMPFDTMFLTVMAFKVFYEEDIDVCIIEVGIGGEYDITNILNNTAVAGITSLGHDHIQLLGKSIEEIAWHKAGIMKPTSVVVTAANQPDAAMKILQNRAADKNRPLYVAPDLSEYESGAEVVLGIGGPIQSLNASLALQLVNAWMNSSHYQDGKEGKVKRAPTFTLSKEMVEGLRACSWPGRAQVLQWSKTLSYYLDCAHTDDSIRVCLEWFEQLAPPAPKIKRVLVLNLPVDRDTKYLLKLFLPHRFDFVCFCTNNIENSTDISSEDHWFHVSDEVERGAENDYRYWLELNSNFNEKNTMLIFSVNEAHELMQKLAQDEELRILVTGSLILVGAFLRILNSQNSDGAVSHQLQ